MHPPEVRHHALQLYRAGTPIRSVARMLQLPYRTVWDWSRDHGDARRLTTAERCFRCCEPARSPEDSSAYAYLLGLYLGDGYLVTSARIPVLRIACANTWPRLIDACEAAMLAVLARSVQRVQMAGCVAVQSYGKHWPCLLPQHGPGKKHNRRIVLADWQQPIVDQHAGHFLRGLFHSDGCRIVNNVTVRGKAYAYPRYLFTNKSADIMRLCQEALDLLGIAWRMNRPNSLSVAHRDAVAALDRHVGPKS